jgi:hypothetical protein
MNALGEKETCTGMAQIVKSHAAQLCPDDDVIEGLIEGARFKGRSNARGEDKSTIVPARARR